MTVKRRTPSSAVPRALLVLIGLSAAVARADGAFPVTTQVFLPTAHPHRIVMGTNIGLYISEDDGSTWRVVPELTSSPQTRLGFVWSYQMGPDEALYALSWYGIAISTDEGCTWTQTAWNSTLFTADLFVDPNDAQTLLAIGRNSDATVSRLYRSRDRGVHFGELIFDESAGVLVGVEVARDAGSVMYVTGSHKVGDAGAAVTFIAHSDDDAQSFAITDHPELGINLVGIIQVDASDPSRAYLRVGYQGQDALVLGSDGGVNLTTLLQLPGAMGGFARTDDGTLWVVDAAGNLWSSRDGGFELTMGPHGACLGARGSSLFVCGSSTIDGFDLGRSDDHGQTFQRLLLLSDKSQVIARDCGAADGGVLDAGNVVLGDGGSGTSPSSHCGCDGTAGGLALFAAWVLARAGTRSSSATARARDSLRSRATR